MSLIHVLCMVLVQLGSGCLLFLAVQSHREIRLSFFTLTSGLGAVCLALALGFGRWFLDWNWVELRFLALTVIGAAAGLGCYRMGWMSAGRLAVTITSLFGLTLVVMPWAMLSLERRGIMTTVGWFFQWGHAAGALLLGASMVGMILGHWYLIMRSLSFSHLDRMTGWLIATVIVRGMVVALTILMLERYDVRTAARLVPMWTAMDGGLMFMALRILLGIILPLALGVMVYRCVKREANQAATGLLYVIVICTLFAELFAAHLLV